MPDNHVQLVPHSETWTSLFEEEARALRVALEGLVLDLQHVGSTAVPGIRAKPIIDIAAAVRERDHGSRCVEPLSSLGYEYRGDLGIFGGHFFAKRASDELALHLHIVALQDPQWLGYVTLRDYLVRNPEARREYEERKLELAAAHPGDGDAYTRGKTGIILRFIHAGLAELRQNAQLSRRSV